MTKEKAIPILETIKRRAGDMSGFDPDAGYEAISVAIRSLEEWDKVLEEINNLRETEAVGDIGYLAAKAHNAGLSEAVEILNKHLSEVGGGSE